MLFCGYRISTELIFEYVRIPIQEMAAENRAGPKAAYDISPEEVYQLNLLEAEEKCCICGMWYSGKVSH